MSFSSQKKYSPSNSAPAIGRASHSRPVNPWSAHAPSLGHSPSPFPRYGHMLSTTATAAGELFLYGGEARGSPFNNLYVFSTRDFFTTLLPTRGESPSPRYSHGVALTSTYLLFWGGWSDSSIKNRGLNDTLYLLNLVSRQWTRVVVNDPRPCGRYFHTVTLVGSKLFVFGGRTENEYYNDIWSLDVNRLDSNPRWELCEPAPRDRKPPPRAGHVSVAMGDRIIVFGGAAYPHLYNDTWSFDILTQKWTELECTGFIPLPRGNHAAVLVDDVMYVFGGEAIDGTCLGDLTALNLSTQRWTTFQDIGPSPSGRGYHAMASDGTRVFVLGGALLSGVLVHEAKPIHVLDTKQLDYSKAESYDINPSEKTTQLAWKLSAGRLTQGQPQERTSSSSDAHAAHGVPSFQRATPEELDYPASPRITHERNPGSNDLLSQPSGVNYKPRDIAEEDDNSEGSTGHHGKLVAPDVSPEKEIARSEDERLVELERKLSAVLAAQSERDRRIAQLTDELAKNSANATEEKRRAGLEQREMQAKLDELLLSRDRVLQKASHAIEANEQSQRELVEVRAELEARTSELAAVHLRLTDVEDGWAKSKAAEADTSRAQIAAGLVNTDEVMRRLMERMGAIEAKLESPRKWNEKSFEMMECRNED